MAKIKIISDFSGTKQLSENIVDFFGIGAFNSRDFKIIWNTEELKKSPEEKMKAIRHQKYYTVGSVILMIVVLFGMYLILN